MRNSFLMAEVFYSITSTDAIQDTTPRIFLINLGMKKEKTNRAMEKKTLTEISSAQFPETQTSLRVPMKKVKIKVPTMNTQTGPGQIIPETDLCQPHAKIHGGKRKVYQSQIQNGCKTIAFDTIIVFSEFVTHQGYREFTAKGPADDKGRPGTDHSPDPHP